MRQSQRRRWRPVVLCGGVDATAAAATVVILASAASALLLPPRPRGPTVGAEGVQIQRSPPVLHPHLSVYRSRRAGGSRASFSSAIAAATSPSSSSSLSSPSADKASSAAGDRPAGEQCPFSMPFPRYRIDLSSCRGQRQSKKDASSTNAALLSLVPDLGGLFAGIRFGMDRSAVEGAYAADTEAGRLRWVECRSDSDRKKEGEGDGGEGKKYEGVRAAAHFWRAASDCAVSAAAAAETGFGELGEGRVVLALFGMDTLTARRLADVANWLADRTAEGSFPELDAAPVVRVNIDEESSAVPVVIFSATSSAGAVVSVDKAVSEDAVKRRLKSWVRRVLVDLSVCPFTKSDARSGQGLSDLGVPVGRIAYHCSHADTCSTLSLLADAWEAILDMMEAGPSGRGGVSSILLAAPGFDDAFPFWAGPVFATLEATVAATGSEPLVGVVCFHPCYLTPDGTTFPGFGHMHSVPRLRKWLNEQEPELSEALDDGDVAAGGAWQRRTPHATINVLRADQLERAEGRRDTPELYSRNIGALVGTMGGVGCPKLEEDLKRERELQ